jgi:cytochrome c oxidase assembly protein subunit 15
MSRQTTKEIRYFIWGLVVYTYLVVYTGALVAHTGAALSCGMQVLGCGSTYLPSFTSLAGIQMLHRYAAVLLWLVTLAFLVMVLRTVRERRDLVKGAWWAFVLVTLQAASGAGIVLSDGQLLAGIIHVTVISTYFVVLSYLCLQIGWPWRQSQPALMLESSTARSGHHL